MSMATLTPALLTAAEKASNSAGTVSYEEMYSTVRALPIVRAGTLEAWSETILAFLTHRLHFDMFVYKL